MFWKKPKPARFSLENLRHLYGFLEKNPIVTGQNMVQVEEAIRSVGEIMIWSVLHVQKCLEWTGML